jgi:hypothetical protein
MSNQKKLDEVMKAVNPQTHAHLYLWLLQCKCMVLENYCSEPKQPYEKKLNVLPGYLDLVKQTIPNLNMVNKRKWLHKLDDVVKILVEICVDLNQAMMGLSLVRTCLTFI